MPVAQNAGNDVDDQQGRAALMGINRCMNCGAEDFVPYDMHDEYTNPQLCYHVCPE